MSLDRHDYQYFDGKFAEVHDKCNEVHSALVSHVASPCHEAQKGWPLKAWGLFGTILTIVVTLLLFLERYLGAMK